MKLYQRLRMARQAFGLKDKDLGFFNDILSQAHASYYFLQRYGDYFESEQNCVNDENQINSIILAQPITCWQFWHNGLSSAPDIVKQCHRSVQKYCEPENVIFLDIKTIGNHVEIPGYIYDKMNQGQISKAHFSDILRTALLSQQGGVWLDSTVYLSDHIPCDLIKEKLFAFSTPPVELLGSPFIKASSWFLIGKINSIILKKLLAFLLEFWRNEICHPHYYTFHLAFCLLTESCIECKKEWEKVEFFTQINPHLLQRSLINPFNKVLFEKIKAASFVHKLTYYGLDECKTNAETFLDHILAEKL